MISYSYKWVYKQQYIISKRKINYLKNSLEYIYIYYSKLLMFAPIYYHYCFTVKYHYKYLQYLI